MREGGERGRGGGWEGGRIEEGEKVGKGRTDGWRSGEGREGEKDGKREEGGRGGE